MAQLLEMPALFAALGLFQSFSTALQSNKHWAITIEAPSGSGKSTELPACLSQFGTIVVVCKSHFSATELHRYVSSTSFMNGHFNGWVELRLPEVEATGGGQSPLIVYMTDAGLAAIIKNGAFNRFMANKVCLMLDDVSSPSLAMDFILENLPFLLRDLPAESNLQALLVAAKINLTQFGTDHFSNMKSLKVQGPTPPIKHTFLSSKNGRLAYNVVNEIRKIHSGEYRQPDGSLKENPGVLIFVARKEGRMGLIKRLNQEFPHFQQGELVHHLHSGLTVGEQGAIAAVTGEKYIVTDDVAQSGVTIKGVDFVILSGMTEMKAFSLLTAGEAPVRAVSSKTSEDLRAGRGGRTGPSHIIHLYTKEDYNHMPFYQAQQAAGDGLQYVMDMAGLRPGYFPDKEGMEPTFPLRSPIAIHPTRAAIITAMKILGGIGVVNGVPHATHQGKLGLELTPPGLKAWRIGLSLRPSIFWAMQSSLDSEPRRWMMCQLAVILMLQEDGMTLVDTHDRPGQEQLMRRASQGELDDLRVGDIDVAASGDIKADWVHLKTIRPNLLKVDGYEGHLIEMPASRLKVDGPGYYCFNPGYISQHAKYSAIYRKLVEHCVGACDEFNLQCYAAQTYTDDWDICMYRLLAAFPDRLVKINDIDRGTPERAGQVGGTILFSKSHCQVAIETAHDFTQYLDHGLQRGPPNKNVYCLYFTSKQNGPVSTTIRRIAVLSEKMVDDYNQDIWKGQFFEIFNVDLMNNELSL